MRRNFSPGSISGRRVDKAGDPLEGLINLFDLSLVLAVGLLLAALSSIGATGLIVDSSNEKPLKGPPPSGSQQQGQGQEVGKVYRRPDGSYIFAPSGGGATGSAGSTAGTGATGGAGAGSTGATGGTTTPPPTTPSPGVTGTSGGVTPPATPSVERAGT